MFDERLPVHIDPLKMAETGRLLQGRYSLEEMDRMHDALRDHNGVVSVSLEFGIDAEGIRYMKGRLQTELTLECQRCLQTMHEPVDAAFALGLVRGDEAAERLPSHYEPLQVEGDALFLRDIIEDELLLALPLVAMHEQCIDVNQHVTDDAQNESNEECGECVKANPFAALAALKSNGNT